jgi:hypothetical protein
MNTIESGGVYVSLSFLQSEISFGDDVGLLCPTRNELETNQKRSNQLKNSKSKNRLRKKK